MTARSDRHDRRPGTDRDVTFGIMAVATLSARMLLRVVDHCASRGVDEGRLLREVDLTRAALAEPEARVAYHVVERVGMRALALTGDADLGLHLAQDAARQSHVDAGVLLLMASPTVRSALEQMVRYQRFWGDGDRASLVPVREGLAVRYLLRGAAGSYVRHADECALAEIVIGLRAFSGHAVTPVAVRFRHPPPPSLTEHRTVFGCPLEFRALHTEVEFDGATCSLPMQHAHALFQSIFQQQVAHTIARLPSDARAAGLVRDAARTALRAGRCTVGATARGLGLSTRTMQRQLRAEGTSFAEIVDALRCELAGAYLDRGLPIPEVAGLLGYADVTAFHHAFRRWTGTTPLRRSARHGAVRE